MVQAVIFDMDGVLIDSESAWDAVRRALVEESGGEWQEGSTEAMMGMSSTEWSRHLRDELGVDMDPGEISAEVVRRLEERYRRRLPLLDGAPEAVDRMAVRWPLGLASSSNRPLIDLVLDLAGLGGRFSATLSSEEVARGKPAPDVYLEAARRVGADPRHCVAVEDSKNGILSAAAAGMCVVAIPTEFAPPGEEALARAAAVLGSLAELTPEAVEAAGAPSANG